jgi:hypothetical protein
MVIGQVRIVSGRGGRTYDVHDIGFFCYQQNDQYYNNRDVDDMKELIHFLPGFILKIPSEVEKYV